MDKVFGPEPPDEDDFATMVAELRGRLDRETVARAIGVEPSELDLLAAGYTPKPEAAERLRLLYGLASKTDDLSDPKALFAALGVPTESEARLPFALMPRLKTYVVAFFVLDAIVFAGFVVVSLVLR